MNLLEKIRRMSDHEKIQNLSALAVVLAGLFLGSLFIDAFQFATGRGFSGHAILSHSVLESRGKTWVGYAEPRIEVQVLTDSSCLACDPSEALRWLRRAVPTIEVTEVDRDSEQGKLLLKNFQVASLPAFIFSSDVAKTSFFSQTQALFSKHGPGYLFNMGAIGLSAGEYLAPPELRSDDTVLGSREAAVKIFEYSDFQCVYCRGFHEDLAKIASVYGDQIAIVFRHLPLSFHARAEDAALAAECAREQGKFPEYASKLFSSQDEWNKTSTTQKFKDYAREMRLDTWKFGRCLDSGKYASRIAADAKEASDFGISATPSIFVNGEFFSGALSYDQLKQVVDHELGK